MRREIYLSVGLSLGCLLTPSHAFAFCRTTTCELSPGYFPTDQSCYPSADLFAAECYCTSSTDFEQCLSSFAAMPVKPVVTAHTLWWRNTCVSYDVNQAASKQVPYGAAAQIAAAAFSKWTGALCPQDGGVSPASVEARDLGPVSCDEVQYNSNQGNQHLILFHDDVWPYNDSANTLGLTTVTYDPQTGEIYDADTEINATVKLGIDAVSATEYDLPGILTHEVGHFFGLAHTPDPDATMYATYEPGSITKRVLSADDVAGFCSIYGNSGWRAVETWSSAGGGSWISGEVAASACDPTPRHGFQSECAAPQGGGCAVAGRAISRDFSSIFAATGLLGALLARRKRNIGRLVAGSR